MTRDEPISEEIASACEAAADHFEAGPLSFWDHIGNRTIELAKLNPGDRILDVGCGSGASAIPAAKVVGPVGRVVAVDLSEKLLELGRAKAAKDGLRRLRMRF